MKHKLDLATWERNSVFKFFQDFTDSSVAVTTEIDCGDAFTYCKVNHKSFAIFCLYAMARGENEVREMRYRIEDDGQSVYEYDRVGILTPIKVNEAGKFVEVYLRYHEDFNTFYPEAYRTIHSVNEHSDPYEYTTTHADDQGMMTVSITPDLYFTSITTTSRNRFGNSYPLANIGKVMTREGRMVMPVAVNFNHALMDGFNISRFFKIVENTLKNSVL